MKKQYRYILFSIIILIIGIFTFTNFNNNFNHNPNQEKINQKVRVANLPVNEGLPFYVAMEKGYFKEENIDIEYIKFEAPNQIIDAVISGKVDIITPSGAMGISAIADSKDSGKIKIYAAASGTKEKPLNTLFVGNKTNINSIADLKDKKLGHLPGIQWKTIATEILAQNNLKAGIDVTLVELAPSIQKESISSGAVDALIALEPIRTILKENNIEGK